VYLVDEEIINRWAVEQNLLKKIHLPTNTQKQTLIQIYAQSKLPINTKNGFLIFE